VGRNTQLKTFQQILAKKRAAQARAQTLARLAGTPRARSRSAGQGRRAFGPGARPTGGLGFGGITGLDQAVRSGEGWVSADPRYVNTAPLPAPAPNPDGSIQEPEAPAIPNYAQMEAQTPAGTGWQDGASGYVDSRGQFIQAPPSTQVGPGGSPTGSIPRLPGGAGAPIDLGGFKDLIPLGGGMFYDVMAGTVRGFGGGNSFYQADNGRLQ
jgi:hypothetical protein